jgi:hypothetical protein
MIKNFQHCTNGYIALMSATIISLILLGMTFTLASGGYYSRFNALNKEYKKVSLGLAESCANVALLEVAQNYNFTVPAAGSSTLVGGEHCLIKSVSFSPTDSATHRRTVYITSQGEYHGAYSNITVSASVVEPAFSSYARSNLVIWQETTTTNSGP